MSSTASVGQKSCITTTIYADNGQLVCKAAKCFKIKGPPPPCAPVAPNMVLWLPMDETSGITTANTPGGNLAALVGGAQFTMGKVANALRLDGASGYAEVRNYSALWVGLTDLTITAWVRRGSGTDAGDRIILDKSSELAPLGSWARGFRLYLHDGKLCFQMADGLGTVASSIYASGNVVPKDGVFHFVAVTVRRTDPGGLQFYLDDQAVGTPANPTGHSGLLGTTKPLRIGARASYPDVPGGFFLGDIDEVEFYRRALSKDEIEAIYSAGVSGDCRTYCQVPTETAFCQVDQSITATANLCNVGTTAKTFALSFQGLPSGVGCTIPGPTSFSTNLANPITVQPGECRAIKVTMPRPAQMTAAGLVACYAMTATPTDGGDPLTCQGALRDRRDWCCHFPGDVAVLPVGTITNLLLMIHNTGGTSPLWYRISIRDDRSWPDSTSVSVNGLGPGTPVTGTLTIAQGDSIALPLTVAFTDYQPLRFYTLLVEGDITGAGDWEPLGTMALENSIPAADSSATAGVTESQHRTTFVLRSIAPNPTEGEVSFQVDLPDAGRLHIGVFDIAGRRIRSLADENALPGIHTLRWDGSSEAGGATAPGIYFLRATFTSGRGTRQSEGRLVVVK